MFLRVWYLRAPWRCSSPRTSGAAAGCTGWARGSRFVYSQHVKACREVGLPEEKIQAIRAEPGTADLQLALEGSGILLGWNLALEDALFVGTVRQCPAQLPLGRSVMASRLDMVKAKGDRPFKRALEVGL